MSFKSKLHLLNLSICFFYPFRASLLTLAVCRPLYKCSFHAGVCQEQEMIFFSPDCQSTTRLVERRDLTSQVIYLPSFGGKEGGCNFLCKNIALRYTTGEYCVLLAHYILNHANLREFYARCKDLKYFYNL